MTTTMVAWAGPVAYVLGAGGARGARHIGQLQALEAAGATPDLVVGVSVGALNGALLSIDLAGAAERLRRAWQNLRLDQVFPLAAADRRPRSLFAAEGLRRLVDRWIGDRSFADLTVPLVVVTTDAVTGAAVLIDTGPLAPALLASVAIPRLLPPVVRDGRALVDGGVASLLPVRVAQDRGARTIVAMPASRDWHRPVPAWWTGRRTATAPPPDAPARPAARTVYLASPASAPLIASLGGFTFSRTTRLVTTARTMAEAALRVAATDAAHPAGGIDVPRRRRRDAPPTVAFVTIDAIGHLNPTLAVVRRLVDADVRVVYFAPETFRAPITATGAVFEPLPPFDVQPRHPDQMRAALIRAAATTLPSLVDRLSGHGAGLVVHDSLALDGYLAARVLGLPTIAGTTTFAFGPAVPAPPAGLPALLRVAAAAAGRHHRRDLSAAYAQLRTVTGRLGLSGSVPDPLALTGDDTVVYTGRGLQPAAGSFGPAHHFVGPVIDDRVEHDDLPWHRLPTPLVYVSFGTMFPARPGLLDAAARALPDAGVVVATGDGEHPHRWPGNVVARHRVPQLAVLRRASVMVSHGGMNSVHEALLHGVPLLVVPHGADQPLVARQVAAAGAGIVLSPGRATRARIRRALTRLLTDPAYGDRARQLGDELHDAGGAAAAAAVITGRLRRPGPTPTPATGEPALAA